MKRISSAIDCRNLIGNIDWSDNSMLKTVGFFIGVTFTNFLNYTEITPILIKTLVVAMIIDTIVGARVARKIRGDFSSRQLRGGIYGKVLYLIVFLGLAYILKGLNLDYKWLPTSMFTILVIAEVISFLNNMVSLRTGKITYEFDLITVFLKVLKGIFKFIADTIIEKFRLSGKTHKKK